MNNPCNADCFGVAVYFPLYIVRFSLFGFHFSFSHFSDELPLRPNPGPEQLPPELSWAPFVAAAAGIATVIALAVWAWHWWRRRPTPLLPAHEVALAELHRI